MITWINKVVSRILFGKIFEEGYVSEPLEKTTYELSSLFPNERAEEQVTQILDKKNLNLL